MARKIYLSGQINGLSRMDARYAFRHAASVVESMYSSEDVMIVNPMELPPVQSSWADYLIRDLMLLKECDEIVMLKNWEVSPGAKVEKTFAEGMGIKVTYL